MDFVGASESNGRATVLQTILENIAVSGLHSCRMIAVHQDHPIRRLCVSIKRIFVASDVVLKRGLI